MPRATCTTLWSTVVVGNSVAFSAEMTLYGVEWGDKLHTIALSLYIDRSTITSYITGCYNIQVLLLIEGSASQRLLCCYNAAVGMGTIVIKKWGVQRINYIKLFKTNNLETVTYCRTQFNFDLPSTVLKERSDAFV